MPRSGTEAPARAVMCLGTASHVGKSMLTAALCRIYARRGLRVAPFEALNMALNSFVTLEGGELGRAQAYQARAAGVEPHVDMNPVLLKPDARGGSQVIVLGRAQGHMTVAQYRAYLPTLWPTVTAAYERLRSGRDLLVLEGAGSAAEIDLRDQDIVNMRMARYAQCPVLLVGDIDRGGVFAGLIGHMELFTPAERALVKGFVVNKLRGDATLLDPGLEVLRERTGVPTLGVIPLLEDWSGDEEDALAVEYDLCTRPSAPLHIAVPRLPHIGCSTDLAALAEEPDVAVRFVSGPEGLAGAAAIVLPGSKSTIADLHWLRARGLAAGLTAAAAAGTPVVGICGGYQMLGRRILDPLGVESDEQAVEGLGLLPVTTTFHAEKRTARVEAELLADSPLGPPGTPLTGYELHMGRTTPDPGAAFLLRLWEAGREGGAGQPDGAVAAGGPPATAVCGTYLHGLFDHPALRAAFVNRLRAAHGLPQRESRDRQDETIDRLADHVAAHLDLDRLDRIIGV